VAVGLSAVDFANRVLNHMLRAVASTAPAANYVKLAIGDPGAAGATNPSANTTRVAVTFSAASAGSCTSSNTPSWASWASGSETLSHVAIFDAATAGTFLYSAALTTAKSITNGDTFTLSSLVVTLSPLAA
jgi:hypothetical protein